MARTSRKAIEYDIADHLKSDEELRKLVIQEYLNNMLVLNGSFKTVDEVSTMLAKLTYALTIIQIACEDRQKHNKRKIEVDAILKITKGVLDG